MQTGAITSYIDVAQLTLYGFFIFFAGLILYLRREDKREGYPLDSDRSRQVRVQGFPPLPSPKTFILAHGGTVQAPGNNLAEREIHAKPVGLWPGAPLHPTGNPMLDGVGPASYALRSEEPERTYDGLPMIVPMRIASDMSMAIDDADPRGMEVIGADGRTGGVVSDLWVDRSEPQIRYLEVEVDAAAGTRNVLLPIHFARISGARRQVKVNAIMAHQFADVPGTTSTDQVSKREEDQISAYYAGGTLYASPSRLGPLV
jgi:photosynthetic reaction center H subunit